MKNFVIFVSRDNVFEGSTMLLKKEVKLNTEIICIESFVENRIKRNFSNEDIILFKCCNSKWISRVIYMIETTKCIIINKEYFANNYSKIQVQERLSYNLVKIPFIHSITNVENLKYPLYCKENKHQGVTIKVFNKITLTRFFEKFDIRDFYFEESVDDIKETSEIKIYYVKGQIFREDKGIVDEELKGICQKISSSLNELEIFSSDIIKTKEEYYVIDVNACAGFYLSKDARKEFIKILENS
ncbi:MAG: hypothetical protein Q4G05_01055 [Clostridia bacterium]|nr:hypothetical protein [Clostridia bacterium]